MAQKLRGVFTPNLVPLDAHGDINEAELRRYVDWLIARGVHGLYPNGSTGEFTRFTVEERRRIIKIVCEQTNGRVPILAGAAEANVAETIKACETYHDYGATAVAIVSPFYFKLSPESVYAYFREIALHSPIDVTLYNIPMFASPIDLPTIRRLAEFPRVVGIKDSSGDVAFMMRMISAIRPQRPDFVFLTGWDCVLVPMMMAGANGGTNASSNAVPEVTRRVYELTKAGRYEDAMKWQHRLLELFDAMLNNFEFPDGFRAGADLRGFNFGRGRQPQTAKQRTSRTSLASTLECLVADFQLIDKPGTCAARNMPALEPLNSASASNSGSDPQMTDLVQRIMGELKTRGLV
ncbi:MAG TPA: dihydrodipicolinate synthase family protein [Humisphaera sp.]|nr:dihydrodipicolinate synthase family protein [Humisphaera sp.]